MSKVSTSKVIGIKVSAGFQPCLLIMLNSGMASQAWAQRLRVTLLHIWTGAVRPLNLIQMNSMWHGWKPGTLNANNFWCVKIFGRWNFGITVIIYEYFRYTYRIKKNYFLSWVNPFNSTVHYTQSRKTMSMRSSKSGK